LTTLLGMACQKMGLLFTSSRANVL